MPQARGSFREFLFTAQKEFLSLTPVPNYFPHFLPEHTEKIFFEFSAIGDRPPHPSLSRQVDQPRSTRCINITDSQPWYLVRLYL